MHIYAHQTSRIVSSQRWILRVTKWTFTSAIFRDHVILEKTNRLNDLGKMRVWQCLGNTKRRLIIIKLALGTGKACATLKGETTEQTSWWAPPELIQSQSFYKYHPAHTQKDHKNFFVFKGIISSYLQKWLSSIPNGSPTKIDDPEWILGPRPLINKPSRHLNFPKSADNCLRKTERSSLRFFPNPSIGY